jgi:hypothetical protein
LVRPCLCQRLCPGLVPCDTYCACIAQATNARGVVTTDCLHLEWQTLIEMSVVSFLWLGVPYAFYNSVRLGLCDVECFCLTP